MKISNLNPEQAAQLRSELERKTLAEISRAWGVTKNALKVWAARNGVAALYQGEPSRNDPRLRQPGKPPRAKKQPRSIIVNRPSLERSLAIANVEEVEEQWTEAKRKTLAGLLDRFGPGRPAPEQEAQEAQRPTVALPSKPGQARRKGERRPTAAAAEAEPMPQPLPPPVLPPPIAPPMVVVPAPAEPAQDPIRIGWYQVRFKQGDQEAAALPAGSQKAFWQGKYFYMPSLLLRVGVDQVEHYEPHHLQSNARA